MMGKTNPKKHSSTHSPQDESVSKKRKKNRNHGRHVSAGEESAVATDIFSSTSAAAQTPIKLKIKIGGQTMSTQNISVPKEASPVPDPIENIEIVECEEINVDDMGESFIIDTYPHLEYAEDSMTSSIPLSIADNSVDDYVNDDEAEDDESRWLNALEAGDLDDNGDLKKLKNNAQLTARQKALLHGENISELMQLPSGYRTVQLTEEQLKGKEEKANQRRQLALEKTEKNKKDTVDRLLKKQEAKAKMIKTTREKKSHIPMYRYLSNSSSITISVPDNFRFPLEASTAPQPSPLQLCSVPGCNNPKKYSCSKSGVALCSLQCYKANQQRLESVTCTVIAT